MHEKERGLAAPFTCAYFLPQPQPSPQPQPTLVQPQQRQSLHLQSVHGQLGLALEALSMLLMAFSSMDGGMPWSEGWGLTPWQGQQGAID